MFDALVDDSGRLVGRELDIVEKDVTGFRGDAMVNVFRHAEMEYWWFGRDVY